ncbi:hypothetical protein BH10PAT3_BH10PAT3_5020 [soil metagenome]
MLKKQDSSLVEWLYSKNTVNTVVESVTLGIESANEWADSLELRDVPLLRQLHGVAVGYNRSYQAFYGLQAVEEDYGIALEAEMPPNPKEISEFHAEMRWYNGMLHATARHICRRLNREFGLNTYDASESGQSVEHAAYLGLQASRLLFNTLDNPPASPDIRLEIARASEHS